MDFRALMDVLVLLVNQAMLVDLEDEVYRVQRVPLVLQVSKGALDNLVDLEDGVLLEIPDLMVWAGTLAFQDLSEQLVCCTCWKKM